MRFLLKTTGFLLIAGLLLASLALAWGHVHIQRLRLALPSPQEVLEPDRSLQLPVRLTWINTASQRMPRSAVLDPATDPHPDADYVMSHPAFVVEWQDGRIFMIDLGMDTLPAMDFGLPAELFAGADSIKPHGPASARLGDHRRRIAGIGFTHLHADHTGGLDKLCVDLGMPGPDRAPIPVFQHHNQLALVNHTTHGPKARVEAADCAEVRTLGGASGLIAVPDFPGLYAIPVAGHTPGSTMYVIQQRTHPGGSKGHHDDVKTWVVTGDVVNHFQGIERGLSKPQLYRMLIVPENDEWLAEVRTFLRELSRHPGVRLLVNHDQEQLETTGLPIY